MKIFTPSNFLETVAQRWRKQYPEGHKMGADKDEIYKKLLEIDPKKATKKSINTLIGNDAWTCKICDECGKTFEHGVGMNEPEDYYSRSVYLCINCIETAHNSLIRNG